MELEAIIDEIRAMGSDRSLPVQGERCKQVLLQTIQEILEFAEGKPVEKVGYKGNCSIFTILVVSGVGIHEMWAVDTGEGSCVSCIAGN